MVPKSHILVLDGRLDTLFVTGSVWPDLAIFRQKIQKKFGYFLSKSFELFSANLLKFKGVFSAKSLFLGPFFKNVCGYFCWDNLVTLDSFKCCPYLVFKSQEWGFLAFNLSFPSHKMGRKSIVITRYQQRTKKAICGKGWSLCNPRLSMYR